MILAPTLTLLSDGLGALQRPTFSRDFAGEKTLNNGTGPAITFTRASNATYFDASGVLQTAGTDVPRFTHDPATLESRGLLIEEARTNSLPNSQMTGVGAGSAGTAPTSWNITGSTAGLTRTIATSTVNGFTVIDVSFVGTISNTGSPLNVFLDPQAVSAGVAAASGQTWTSSVYLQLLSGSVPTSLLLVTRGRDSGNVATSDITTTTVTPTATLTRYTATRAMSSGSTAKVTLDLRLQNIPDTTVVNITLRIAAPQLEQGAFATSYIPTTTAAANRSADLAVVTPVSDFVSATEGTIFAEFRTRTVSGTRVAASLDDDTADERIRLLTDGTDPKFVVTDGGSVQADIDAGTVAAETVYKMAGAFKADDFAVSLNGAAVGTDTSGTIPSMTHLRIGSGPSGDRMNGGIRKIAYYPKRLSNALLQQLTT